MASKPRDRAVRDASPSGRHAGQAKRSSRRSPERRPVCRRTRRELASHLTVIVPVHRRSVVHGLPPIRLHDLRHTAATLALTAGIHPKVVSERLGPATGGITLDTYSHVGEGLQGEAATRDAGMIVGAADTGSGEERSCPEDFLV